MSVDRKNILSVLVEDVYTDCEQRTHMWQNSHADSSLEGFTMSRMDIDQIVRWCMEACAYIADTAGYVKHFEQTGLEALHFWPSLEKKTVTPDYCVEDNVTQTDLYDGQTLTATITDIDGNELSSVLLKENDIVQLDGQTTTTENGYYRIGNNYSNTVKFKDLTNSTTQTHSNDGEIILKDDIQEREYEDGEKIPRNRQQTITFNVTDALDQNKYTVVQQFIKSALQSYVLSQWWKIKGVSDQAGVEYSEFEKFLGKVRYNSVVNHKNRNKVRSINYHY